MEIKEKRNTMLSLLDQLNEIQNEKKIVVKAQEYEACAKLRDEEKALMKKMDELSGIKDCYHKIISSEKILKHLDQITESTKELKKIRPEFKEVFEDLNFDKHLITLYRQRDEALVAVLQLKEYLKII